MSFFPLNIILFTGLTLLFSWLGIYLNQVHAVAGAELIFLCAPFLLALLLGLRDSSINLLASLSSFKFRAAWRWYVFALLVYPLIYLLITLLGLATGIITETSWQTYPAQVTLSLPVALGFAFLEETAWRGYLEPLLAARGYSQVSASFAVGSIWALWHLPQFIYGYYPIYAAAPLRFFCAFALTLLVTAQVYGIMRRRSGVVWTSVLMHGVANAFLFPLVLSAKPAWSSYQSAWFIVPTPAGVASLVLWCGILGGVLTATRISDTKI